MNGKNLLIFFWLPTLFMGTAFALSSEQNSEQGRLSGFAEHQKNQIFFDENRRKGERAYFEEQEKWEIERTRTRAEYKKGKKQAEMGEDGPEAREDKAEKKEFADQYEEARRSYAKNHARQDALRREALGLPSEIQELGLDDQRPRYDHRKRAMFGGQPKYGKIGTPGSGASVSSGDSSPRGSFGSGGSSFPPPPTFDDFGGSDGGYVPAPSLPEDYGDVAAPPPPPPPLPLGDDPGGFTGEGIDFSAPPPPPPFPEEGSF